VVPAPEVEKASTNLAAALESLVRRRSYLPPMERWSIALPLVMATTITMTNPLQPLAALGPAKAVVAGEAEDAAVAVAEEAVVAAVVAVVEEEERGVEGGGEAKAGEETVPAAAAVGVVAMTEKRARRQRRKRNSTVHRAGTRSNPTDR